MIRLQGFHVGLTVAFLLGAIPTEVRATEEPCAVFFYGRYTQAETKFIRSIVRDYEIEADVGLAAQLQQRAFFRYDAPDDFVKRDGIAYYLQPDKSRLMVVRFVPMPNEKSFAQFVRHTAEMLGENTVVSGTETRKKLHPTEGTPEFMRYDKRGIAITGWEPRVHTISVGPLLDSLGTIKDKHSFFSVRPSVIPKRTRVSVLKQIAAQQSAALQQRDDENALEYRARKLLGATWSHITEAFILEVTEVSLWCSLPADGQPFKASLKVSFAAGGAIDRSTRRWSRTRPKLRTTDDDTIVASLHSAMHLNRAEVEVLKGLSARFPERLQPLLTSALVQNLELAAVVTDLGVGEPVALICTPVRTQSESNEKPIFQIPELGAVVPLRRSENLGATPVTVVQLSREEVNSAVPLRDLLVEDRAAVRPNWIDLRVDLANWTPRVQGTGSEKIVRWLEKSVDIWEHRKLFVGMPVNIDPRVRSQLYPYKASLAPEDFTSLVPRLANEGDWKGRLAVRRNGLSIVASTKIGEDLYRWVAARQLLAKMRARKP